MKDFYRFLAIHLQTLCAITLFASPERPPNDNFSNAIQIASVDQNTTTLTGTLFGATRESGEPYNPKGVSSVWYKWVAPTAGNISCIVSGGFSCWLFRATAEPSVRTLDLVARDGDAPLVAAGDALYIGVFGPVDSGAFNLQVGESIAPPENDRFDHAKFLTETNGVLTVTGTTLGATYDFHEPHNPNAAGGSVWFRWQPSQSGIVQISGDGALPSVWFAFAGGAFPDNIHILSRDNEITVVTAGAYYYIGVYGSAVIGDQFNFTLRVNPIGPAGKPVNDDFSDATELLEGDGSVTISGNGLGSTIEPNEPGGGAFDSASVWYRWTPTFIPTRVQNQSGTFFLRYFSGSSLTDLTPITTPIPGQTCYVQVSAVGPFKLTLVGSNDQFANAIPLVPGDNLLELFVPSESREPDEPAPDCFPDGGTLWWTYTSPESGILSASGGVHAVYKGTTLKNLRLLGCGPQTETPLNGGETYYLQVRSDFPACRLSFYPKWSNDDFQNAIPLAPYWRPGSPLTRNFFAESFNFASTYQPGEPLVSDEVLGRTHWFVLEAPYDGYATASFLDSTPTGGMANLRRQIYQGSGLDSLKPVPRLAPGHWSPDDHIFSIQAGERYYIQVDTTNSLSSHIQILVETRSSSLSTNDAFANATILPFWSMSRPLELDPDTDMTLFNLMSFDNATSEPGEPTHEAPGEKSLWWRCDSPADVGPSVLSFFLDPRGTIADATIAVYTGDRLEDLQVVKKGKGGLTWSTEPGTTYYIAVAIPAERKGAIAYWFWPASPFISQVIDFPAIPDLPLYTAPIELHATTGSGNPPAFAVSFGPATVSGNLLTVTGAGEIGVTAFEQESDPLTPGAVFRTFNVLAAPEARMPQTIEFDLPEEIPAMGDPIQLHAVNSAGTQLTFTVISGPGSIELNELIAYDSGDIVVRASALGNALFAPAAVERVIRAKTASAIEFALIPDTAYGSGPVTVNAVASSGLPVTFEVESGPAVVTGNAVQLLGVGTVTIAAIDGGDASHAPARVTRSFNVQRAAQTIQFDAVAPSSMTITLHAQASSGLVVSFQVIEGPGTLNGNDLEILGKGPITVQAAQSGNANFLPALSVLQTVIGERIEQTIDFPPLPDIDLAAPSPSSLHSFAALQGAPPRATAPLSAASSSTLPVSFSLRSGPAELQDNVLYVNGPGEIVVDALQSGDNVFAPAFAEQRFTARTVKAQQTIAFAPLPALRFAGEPVEPIALATSGLPVRFEVLSGPAIYNGVVLIPQSPGLVLLRAIQDGNDQFQAAAADQAIVISKGLQTIAFHQTSVLRLGAGSVQLSASANSGLPIRFEIQGPGLLNGTTLTPTAAGILQIKAVQDGNDDFEAASLDEVLTVQKASQLLEFLPIPDLTLGAEPILLSARASSGLPVVLQILQGSASIQGSVLTALAAGPVTVRAVQRGNDTFEPAPDMEQTFVIRRPQTIEFSPPPALVFGAGPIRLVAQTSSELAATFSILSGPGVLQNDQLTITGAGEIIVSAAQSGDGVFGPAPVVQRTIHVDKAPQSVRFPHAPILAYGSPPVALSASASSGLPVKFDVIAGPASVEGQVFKALGAGMATLKISQPGDDNFLPASPIFDSFLIAKAEQSIQLDSPEKVFSYNGPFPLNAIASSALPVTIRVIAGPGELRNNLLQPTGPGTVTIAAEQPGDANFNSAPKVERVIKVLGPPQIKVIATSAALSIAWEADHQGFELQAAQTADGPWEPVPADPNESDFQSPLEMISVRTDGPSKFFRLYRSD